VVQVGGTAIGFLTDFTSDIKAEVIKEYVCQTAPTPAFLASGNLFETFKASAHFVPVTLRSIAKSRSQRHGCTGYLESTRHNNWKPENHLQQRNLNCL
jgi:hypothetical protein